MGTEAGEFRARRRWLSSSRQGPGGGKGVLEDREGVSAGALAAAYTLGGEGDFCFSVVDFEGSFGLRLIVWLRLLLK